MCDTICVCNISQVTAFVLMVTERGLDKRDPRNIPASIHLIRIEQNRVWCVYLTHLASLFCLLLGFGVWIRGCVSYPVWFAEGWELYHDEEC